MSSKCRLVLQSIGCRADWIAALISIALLAATPAVSHASCENIPKAEPAPKTDIKVGLASLGLRWQKPTEPVKIAGPLYFVGTRGLGVFLFATSEGLILMNTGMPSSGPMIVASICKLGFRPEDIKIMINGHAHIDHAGAFSYFKKNYKATLAAMSAEVDAMRAGGKNDFRYRDGAIFPGVEADRVLSDGDSVKLGDVVLTAHHTPGHTRGATTWTTTIYDNGTPLKVVFPDGASFILGYRMVRNPSYLGIADDFRNTINFLGTLKPDIWLAPHNEEYDFVRKRDRVRRVGVDAWIDTTGYKKFVKDKKRAFDDRVEFELLIGTRQRQR
jgi:metallo-beta-lactamase class B